MVKPRSIFINYAGGQDDLAETIGRVLGQRLSKQSLDVGPVHRCRVLDVEFSLFGEHSLDDDSGIAFSQYAYQLDQTAFEDGLKTRMFEAMYDGISSFLAERLCGVLRCDTMVVENLQRKVSEFRFEQIA